MLLPGFVDSQSHPENALMAEGAELQTNSLEQLLGILRRSGPTLTLMLKVIRGYGWRGPLFPATGPTKADLDRLFPDRPVILFPNDGHSAWVNSKALELAGVNASTPDPVPGFSWYQRDPKTNEPTGWLVEVAAMKAVFFKLQPPSIESTLERDEDQTAGFLGSGHYGRL